MTDTRQSPGGSLESESLAQLSGVTAPAMEQAKALAGERKAAGAVKGHALAKAAHRAADDLESQLPLAASYVHLAAERLDRAATALDERSFDELIGEFGQFARNKPATVFGAAALAGFALSRFLKSSAEGGSKRFTAGSGGGA